MRVECDGLKDWLGCWAVRMGLRLQALHVVEVFVRLHVDAQVAFSGGGVLADLATEGLVSTRIRLAS